MFEQRVVHHGLREFYLARRRAAQFGRRAHQHRRLKIEHAPRAAAFIERTAVVHFAGIHHDRVVGARFDGAASARRFMSATDYHANPKRSCEWRGNACAVCATVASTPAIAQRGMWTRPRDASRPRINAALLRRRCPSRTLPCDTLLPGGTLCVSHTLPPITEPRPIVSRAEDRRARVDHHVVLDDRVPRVALHAARRRCRPGSSSRRASRA